MKLKLTKQEKNWVLYDVGNSAFTLLVSTIMPIYFNHLAGTAGLSDVDYLAYWGYAASIATLLVALLGPVFGTMADYKGFKKPIFLAFLAVGAIGCISLGLAKQWLVFLILFVIAKVGYSGSLIFYDSMLPDITEPERTDHVSSLGYAWGYIGSCLPFVACLVPVLFADGLGLSMPTAMLIAFSITAVWWVGMSLPLVKTYQQKHYVPRQPGAVGAAFSRLWTTLKNARKEKKAFLFLLAFFFYIDGVYTIIDMATAYGSALGLDTTGLLLALLLTQIVAFPCAIIFGRLASKHDTGLLIKICIICYTCITAFGMFLVTLWQFWVLATLVGMFQGGIQALSRSYLGKIIKPERSGEFYGLMDICGKGASFLGTTLVAFVSQITAGLKINLFGLHLQNENLAVGSLVVLFIIGFFLFCKADELNKNR